MAQLKFNLLPVELRRSQSDISWIVDKRVIWSVFASFLVMVAALFTWWWVNDKMVVVENELAVLDAKIAERKPLVKQITLLKSRQKEIESKNLALRSIQVSKQKWIIIFETLSSMLPSNMWLTEISQKNSNDTPSGPVSVQLALKGRTHKFNEVAEYLEDLQTSSNIDLVVLGGIKNVRFGGAEIYEYKMDISLNPYLGLGIDSTIANQARK
ncbi:PilN domain-containing protein [bacterium]|nr:PilN domain-containing protein [bacterium]